MTKPKARVAVTDEQIEAARSRARQFQVDDRRAVRVMYEKKADLVTLQLDDGVRISIPRRSLEGLQDATAGATREGRNSRSRNRNPLAAARRGPLCAGLAESHFRNQPLDGGAGSSRRLSHQRQQGCCGACEREKGRAAQAAGGVVWVTVNRRLAPKGRARTWGTLAPPDSSSK